MCSNELVLVLLLQADEYCAVMKLSTYRKYKTKYIAEKANMISTTFS